MSIGSLEMVQIELVHLVSMVSGHLSFPIPGSMYDGRTTVGFYCRIHKITRLSSFVDLLSQS